MSLNKARSAITTAEIPIKSSGQGKGSSLTSTGMGEGVGVPVVAEVDGWAGAADTGGWVTVAGPVVRDGAPGVAGVGADTNPKDSSLVDAQGARTSGASGHFTGLALVGQSHVATGSVGPQN